MQLESEKKTCRALHRPLSSIIRIRTLKHFIAKRDYALALSLVSVPFRNNVFISFQTFLKYSYFFKIQNWNFREINENNKSIEKRETSEYKSVMQAHWKLQIGHCIVSESISEVTCSASRARFAPLYMLRRCAIQAKLNFVNWQ